MAETVTVAERVVILGLACAVRVTVALPEPFAGLAVSHVWLLETFHEVFDVMPNVCVLFADAPIVSAFVETDNVGLPASCVTVMVCELTPVPETVTVAWRVVIFGFACAVKVTEALPEPLAGLAVNHVSLLETVHETVERILNV